MLKSMSSWWGILGAKYLPWNHARSSGTGYFIVMIDTLFVYFLSNFFSFFNTSWSDPRNVIYRRT